MSVQIIDGKAIALDLQQKLADAISSIKAIIRLDIILIGEDPASQLYVGNKIKAAERLGIKAVLHQFPDEVNENIIRKTIKSLNNTPESNGILLQLPIPKHLNKFKLIQEISPLKDIDGLHPLNIGHLISESPGFIPCTPQGCLYLIKTILPNLEGQNVVIIGRSLIVGTPLSQLLLQNNATVTITHSKTKDLAKICKRADILISATGNAHMVKTDWIKKGAIVIDVGINKLSHEPKLDRKNIVGDVCFDEVSQKALAITPVPGGVGPMTITFLLINCLKAYCLQNNLKMPDFLS